MMTNLKTNFKLPHVYQWKQIPQTLVKKEKIALAILFVLFFTSSSFLVTSFYYKNTEIGAIDGGQHIEEMIGAPRFINPVYAAANDVDRDLTELIFSGLMKYDSNGKIVKDLAMDYEIMEEGKIFKFHIKENILWHNQEQLTIDDIIFTIKTIQNPDIKSPLRANWLGVKTEKIDDFNIRFELQKPYCAFLERLTLKILPQHIWQDISPENFPLATIYNLGPIGTGPYQFNNIKQNELGAIISLDLIKFPDYFGEKPYLEKISFVFFEKEKDLSQTGKKEYTYSMPRYFSIFFNPDKLEILKENEIRQALNFAINKQELQEYGKIIDSPILPEIYNFEKPNQDILYEYNPEKAQKLMEDAGFEKKDGKFHKIVKQDFTEFTSRLQTGSKGAEVTQLQTCLSKDSEIYPDGKITGYFGPSTKKAVIFFQEKYAEEILEPWGYKSGTGSVGKTTRAKLNEICKPETKQGDVLKLSLTTVDDPILERVAETIKNQWENFGIDVEIKTFSVAEIENDIIKPRDYECLLFGEALGAIPDPFPYWHSSQKKDPGLNLCKYENKEADALLEKARTTMNEEQRKELYQEFQNILIQDAPAVFLYSPDYLYFVSKEIKGIQTGLISDPSKRFAGIENWYIHTGRQWK